MQRTFALLLLSFVAVVHAQGNSPQGGDRKPMEKSAFLDFAENRMVQYYCERDGTYMQCLGVDIRKDSGRCVELVRQGAKQCKQRLLGSMPASISENAEFNRYAGQFSQCLGLNVMAVAGKSFNEVDQCLSKGSADPKNKK